MMSSMPPDSHKISLKIIEAVKQHPVLYSNEVKGSSIKLQEFRQKVWKRISDELGLDSTWVRLRWKNLRDTYCRILKYKNKTERGARRKKWVFEEHLSFLKFPYEMDYQPQCIELTDEYIQDINAGSTTSEGLLEQLEDRNDDDYSEYLEVLEETISDPLMDNSQIIETLNSTNPQVIPQTTEFEVQESDIETYVQQIQSRYRKIKPKRRKVDYSSTVDTQNNYTVIKSESESNTINSIETNTITDSIFITSPFETAQTSPIRELSEGKHMDENGDQVYLQSESKNGVELFFDSMAQTVKKLPPEAQADVKMHICKIVTEAEVKYSRQNTPQSMQKFLPTPNAIPKLVLIPCSMIDNKIDNIS